MIDIGHMTTLLLDTLATGDPALMIGDGVAPTEGGWTGGTPNTGSFAAYSVLSFTGAAPANPDVNSADPEWATRWALNSHGGSRAQADWMAYQVRKRILTALKQTFAEDDVFKIIAISWNSLGAMVRNDQVDPPYWSTSDNLILTVSRVRNRTP